MHTSALKERNIIDVIAAKPLQSIALHWFMDSEMPILTLRWLILGQNQCCKPSAFRGEVHISQSAGAHMPSPARSEVDIFIGSSGARGRPAVRSPAAPAHPLYRPAYALRATSGTRDSGPSAADRKGMPSRAITRDLGWMTGLTQRPHGGQQQGAPSVPDQHPRHTHAKRSA